MGKMGILNRQHFDFAPSCRHGQSSLEDDQRDAIVPSLLSRKAPQKPNPGGLEVFGD